MVEPPWQQGSSRLQEVLDELLKGLAGALRVKSAAALLVDEERTRCRAAAVCNLSEEQHQFLANWLTATAEGKAYWTRLAAQAGPVYVDPPRTGTRGDGRRRGRIIPHLSVPLIGSGGTLLGMIGLEMGAPSAHEVAIAAAMGRVAAIAIEQAAAADVHAAEVVRNAVLLEIVREVDRRLDLPDVLAVICRKTVEAFDCQHATVFFRSRRHRASIPLADYGTPAHVVERFLGQRYNPGNIPHEPEITAGRTVVISRGREPSPDDLALLDQSENYGLVLIPLRGDDGSVRGILNVGVSEAREFTVEELRALEVVAHHAATAIMRARSLHTTKETARFRAAVSALAVELNTTTSRTQSLSVLCARGSELFGAAAGMLLVQAGGRLVPAATHGQIDGADRLRPSLDDTTTPVVRAFLAGEVVLESDCRRAGVDPPGGLRSLLAIPLLGDDGRGGVLVFGDPRPRRFRESIVEEARVLGALAAAALRNVDLLGRLHESNERLRRLSTLKDQFLANVSHDLRTPLNVIIGYAQLALEDAFGAPTPELRSTLERMHASARQQLVLVQDLLDLSRLELNGLTVQPTAVALAPVFEDMEFLATNLVREKPVRIAVEPVAPDVWVQADPNRLRQVLTNLLSNAAKFTDEGTVGLRAVAEREAVRIDVWDTGIGIAPGEQETIFEPFRQADSARAALGTGLGLAIVRRLTELMGGTIGLESSPGAGSVFSVCLPAIAAPAFRPLPVRVAGSPPAAPAV